MNERIFGSLGWGNIPFLLVVTNLSVVIPGWSQRVRTTRGPMTSSGPDLRCAIAHRGISRFRVRVFDAPGNDGRYSDSGAVAASSQTLVTSSTCGRTSWRTLA